MARDHRTGPRIALLAAALLTVTACASHVYPLDDNYPPPTVPAPVETERSPQPCNFLTGEGCDRDEPQEACLIKGNISYQTGERIYHLPGQEYYDETMINTFEGERWFCTEEEAIAAGWRQSYL